MVPHVMRARARARAMAAWKAVTPRRSHPDVVDLESQIETDWVRNFLDAPGVLGGRLVTERRWQPFLSLLRADRRR
jgi:hypothetical protein